MVTCACGHHAYAGYLAEAAYLSERLHWLEERIAAGDAAPDPATARAYGIWPAPATRSHAPAGSGPTHPSAPHAGQGVQALLLALGAGLLIVAGVVFTAVVWRHLGAAAQVVLMALVTISFGAGAVRLLPRLPGTAEALAVVAFGLTTVDAVSAPALGLVPDAWLDTERAYPAVVALVGAAVAIKLGHVFRLQAWVWLGWATAGLSAALTTWYLTSGVADGKQPGAALSVSVVALAAVALLAGPYLSARLRVDHAQLTAAGSLTLVLAVPTWVNWLSSLDRNAIIGTIGTTLLTGAAAGLVWRRTQASAAGAGAATLVGIAAGLALLLPRQPDARWLGVAAAAAGVVLLAALARAGEARAGLLASAALWTTWALGLVAIGDPAAQPDRVTGGVWVLLALVALTWFVVAALGGEPIVAWLAAMAGEGALLVAHPDLPDVPESWTLPFAALLVVAGYLWIRSKPTNRSDSGERPDFDSGSLAWIGPGAAMALVPSALACWAAPWVTELSDETRGEALIRLVLVLVVGVGVVSLGAQRRLAGLLLPGSIALAVAAAAQLSGGLAAMPRWLAFGLAGGALVLLGARFERLRLRGPQVRTFVHSLH